MKALRIFLLFLLVLFPCLSVRAVEVYQTQPCIDWGTGRSVKVRVQVMRLSRRLLPTRRRRHA